MKIKEDKLIIANQEVDTSVITLEMTWKGMVDKRIKDQIGILAPEIVCEVINGSKINAYMGSEKAREVIDLSSKKLLEDKKLLDFLKEKTIETSRKIREFAIQNINKIENMSNKELIKILKTSSELQLNCTAFGAVVSFSDIFGGISNKLVETLIKRKNLKYPAQVYSQVLTSPKEISFTEKAYEKIRNSKSSIDDIKKEYFWLDQGYIGRGLDEEHIEKIIQEKKKEEKLPSAKGLLEELKLSEKENRVFEISSDIIYVKSLRADSRQFLHVLTNRIIDLISKKLNIESKYLENLSLKEICEILERDSLTLPLSELKKRYAHSVLVPKDNFDRYEILIGKNVEEFLEKMVLREEIKDRQEISGQVAYPGKVRGRIKLVFGPQHNSKVEEGDILVSTATSPQLLPAMKKAAAIVTDIGGITSHAAIVAREMKKPCIVGTKVATRVLKDDMLVEVNAERGIVRVLK